MDASRCGALLIDLVCAVRVGRIADTALRVLVILSVRWERLIPALSALHDMHSPWGGARCACGLCRRGAVEESVDPPGRQAAQTHTPPKARAQTQKVPGSDVRRRRMCRGMFGRAARWATALSTGRRPHEASMEGRRTTNPRDALAAACEWTRACEQRSARRERTAVRRWMPMRACAHRAWRPDPTLSAGAAALAHPVRAVPVSLDRRAAGRAQSACACEPASRHRVRRSRRASAALARWASTFFFGREASRARPAAQGRVDHTPCWTPTRQFAI